ncbi:MAG: hypothetical protein DMG65_20840 [Candidatus Angelobacter sp. Gp1-AA117]|nr:MAG: hypothetical protein DMG65_20840 [Candidatus Angelobacter sp. Gp1-AA117]
MLAGPEITQVGKYLFTLKEFKEQIQIIVVVFGSVLALTRSLIQYTHSRVNVIARRNKELHRAGELVGFLSQLSTAKLPEEQNLALHKEVQVSLEHALQDIDKLNLKLLALEKDPNSHLNPAQKIFLFFRPKGWRSVTFVLLTYACVIGAVAIAMVKHASVHLGYLLEVGTPFLLGFLFHHWALEERRRVLGAAHRRNTRFFFFHMPEQLRVFLAQIVFLLNCMLIVAMGSIQVFKHPFTNVLGFIIPFCFFSFSAFVFYSWGRAELQWQDSPAQLQPFHVALGKLRRSLVGTLSLLLAFPVSGLSFFLAFGSAMNVFLNPQSKTVFLSLLLIFITMTSLPAYGAIRIARIEGSRRYASEPAQETAAEALATSA